MMSKKTSSDNNETLLGLYALSSKKKSTPDDCPSDENMAAFIEHQLSAKKHQTILKHLNHCSTCYKDWMMSCQSIETLMPSQVQETKTGFWEKMWQGINNSRSFFIFGIPSATVLATITILLFSPFTNTVNQQINNMYQQDMIHSASYAVVAEKMLLPWEKISRSFNSSSLSPEARAYNAGLWKGRADILKTIDSPLPKKLLPLQNMPWLKSDYAAYYEFGRWTFLLRTVLESEQELINWKEYKQTKDGLSNNFSQKSSTDFRANQATLALNKLGILLSKLEQSKTKGQRKGLSHQLKSTMYLIGSD
jgi:hypothetical protein